MTALYIIVSVDWEGNSLLPENIDAIQAFRKKHPDIPMQHFLNAAYYTFGGDADTITETISRALLPEDDHGLHLHAWSTLQRRAGVNIRTAPMFCPREMLVEGGIDDAGYAVPMEVFTVEELSKMLKDSVALLTSNGFKRPISFRAGGWQAGPNVFEALAASGFTHDASGANTRIVIRTPCDSLRQRLLSLWANISDESQPYKLSTPKGELWEMPNNGALADFLTTEEMLLIFRKNVALWEQSPEAPIYYSIGFHQETANMFLDRIDDAVTNIKAIAASEDIPIVFKAGL